MPRIRSLKPELVSDVKLARVSRDARLTFIYAITQADDIGLLAGAHRQLLGALYPLDDDVTIPVLLGWIEELVEQSLVRWRSTRDGVPVLQLVNWSKHQRVDNAGRSQLGALLAESPADPPQESEGRGGSPQSAATRGDSPLGSPITDLGPPTKDHLSGITDRLVIARQFTAAANLGLQEHPTRPQPIPRIMPTNGTTHTATNKILDAHVPPRFAYDWIYEQARTHSSTDEIVSLGYFVRGVLAAWNAEEAATDAASAPKGNGKRAHRGRAKPQQFDYTPTASEDDVTWRK